jgi:hypothetical protein
MKKHKRNHEREGVCISATEIMLIHINFNFLTKYHPGYTQLKTEELP